MRAGVVPASSRGIDQLLEPLRYFPELPVFEIAVERSYGIATVEIYDVRVVVHGAPERLAFGERATYRSYATVTRAGPLERFRTRYSAIFELTELYHVGFEPKEASP